MMSVNEDITYLMFCDNIELDCCHYKAIFVKPQKYLLKRHLSYKNNSLHVMQKVTITHVVMVIGHRASSPWLIRSPNYTSLIKPRRAIVGRNLINFLQNIFPGVHETLLTDKHKFTKIEEHVFR